MNVTSGKSTWIFLQPSQRLREQIHGGGVTNASCQTWHQIESIRLHRLFISIGLNSFTEYVEHLQLELTELVCLETNLECSLWADLTSV
jgi:hypothetical protein